MSQAGASTVLEVLRAAEGYLAERGVDAPRLSAEWMIARVLDCGRLQLYLLHDRPLEEAEKARLREMVARRAKHEPLAYILGDQEFFGRTFEVSPATLIPRPETEGLVELAKDVAIEDARCVDLGTGSGAIAVSLALERPDVKVWAVDASEGALAVARRNAARHGVEDRVHFAHGSWWDALADAAPRFDLLVSNPPYVDPDRPELLADDVREYEPSIALFTPAGDPTAPVREILAGVDERLAPGASLLFETGVGAAESSRDLLLARADLADVELRPDLAGLQRYLVARRR